jgi:hypothetical protein
MINFALALHFLFCLSFLFFLGTLSLHGLRLFLQPTWFRPFEKTLFDLLKMRWIVLLFFLPVVFLYPHIFPWASAPETAGTFRAFYLSPASFFGRAALYFGVWFWLSNRIEKRTTLPGPLLLILTLLTGTFSSFDWLMALDLHWRSSIYGFEILLSGTLLAYGICLSRLPVKLEEKVMVDLNNFQLALIALWSYLNIMQLVTVWTANLPEEAEYYLRRLHSPEKEIAIYLALFQTMLPIVLLFFRPLKRSLQFTRGLASVNLFSQTLYLFWIFRKGA